MSNLAEQYNDKELKEMQEYCVYMRKAFGKCGWGYPQIIHEIALIEINRVLNERASRKEE